MSSYSDIIARRRCILLSTASDRKESTGATKIELRKGDLYRYTQSKSEPKSELEPEPEPDPEPEPEPEHENL